MAGFWTKNKLDSLGRLCTDKKQRTNSRPSVRRKGFEIPCPSWEGKICHSIGCPMIPPLMRSDGYSFWGVQVAPEGVELPPGRSQEVKGSLELQNGGQRALAERRMTTFYLRHFSVKSGRLLCFRGVSRWCQEVSSSVQGCSRPSLDAGFPDD